MPFPPLISSHTPLPSQNLFYVTSFQHSRLIHAAAFHTALFPPLEQLIKLPLASLHIYRTAQCPSLHSAFLSRSKQSKLSFKWLTATSFGGPHASLRLQKLMKVKLLWRAPTCLMRPRRIRPITFTMSSMDPSYSYHKHPSAEQAKAIHSIGTLYFACVLLSRSS